MTNKTIKLLMKFNSINKENKNCKVFLSGNVEVYNSEVNYILFSYDDNLIYKKIYSKLIVIHECNGDLSYCNFTPDSSINEYINFDILEKISIKYNLKMDVVVLQEEKPKKNRFF